MQHAVIVRIPLDDEKFGSSEARDALWELEDELTEAVEQADVASLMATTSAGVSAFFICMAQMPMRFMALSRVC